MKAQSRKWRLTMGAVVATTTAFLLTGGSSTGCSQPDIDCRAARGDFAAKFTQTGGDDQCGGFTVGFVGLQSYYPAKEGKQDYSKIFLAIQSEVLGGLLQNSQSFGPDFVDTTNKPYGLGEFTTLVPENGVCSVPTLSESEQDIPEIPGDEVGGMGEGGAGGGAGGGAEGGAGGAGGGAEGGAGGGAEGGAGEGGSGEGGCPVPPDPGPFPGIPATDVKITWSNVKVYVTPNAPGTQFVADMEYEETIDGATCSATYSLIGIWPPVDCGIYEFDECDNLVSATPNEEACHLDPANAPAGSVVINPEFTTTCDPDLLICVPTEPVDALK